MKLKFVILMVLMSAAGASFGGGAPWYKWINRADRTILCSQISPGETWMVYQGPFMESRCKKPGMPQ
jgi:hypothetical protein